MEEESKAFFKSLFKTVPEIRYIEIRNNHIRKAVSRKHIQVGKDLCISHVPKADSVSDTSRS